VRSYIVYGVAALVAAIGAACIASEPTPNPSLTFVPAAVPTTPPPTVDISPTPQAAASQQLPDDPQGLMAAALRRTFIGDTSAVQKMGDSGDSAYIPVLIEFLRFPWPPEQETRVTLVSSLARLIGESPEQLALEQFEWDWWADWLGNHPEVRPPAGYAAWKGQLFSFIVDPAMGAFFYDGVKARIRLEEIVWGGVRKDGIPDLTNPPVVLADEATYLEPSDRVFGVSINGEHRAYPLRVLNPHEMVNDVVGGVPFALAY